MKTKNNIQKAAFKSAIAATGLSMLSLTLNAQDSLKSLFENNGANHMELATKTDDNWFKSNVKTKSFINTNTFAVYLTVETEEPLQVEGWMLDEYHFNVNQKSSSIAPTVNNKIISTSTFIYREVNKESALEIEDWMINSKIWEK